MNPEYPANMRLPARRSRPFWEWVLWLFIAALTYSFLPGKVRLPALALIMFGGIVYLETNYGISKTISQFTKKGSAPL